MFGQLCLSACVCYAPVCSYFGDNALSGTIPESWGQQGAFPMMEKAWLNFNNLTGEQAPCSAVGVRQAAWCSGCQKWLCGARG